MKTKIEELKRLAEANYGWRNASSAWPHKSGDGSAVVGNVDDSHEPAIRNPVAVVDVTQYDGFQDDSMQLAQFYAAANPAAVLELIAEVERVTKQRDELLEALDWLIDRFGVFVASKMTDGDDQRAFDRAVQVRDKVRG